MLSIGRFSQRALARVCFQVEHVADAARGLGTLGHHVGAIAERGRVNDLRDEAIADDQVAEVVAALVPSGAAASISS